LQAGTPVNGKIAPKSNVIGVADPIAQRLTENESSDFSRFWHDGCDEAIIEAQDVDQNHSPAV
jgi:hypothetical protein